MAIHISTTFIVLTPQTYVAGHYVTYVCRPQTNQWRLFDDGHVTAATEADMLREAIGGSSNRSAAALLYTVVPPNEVTPGLFFPPFFSHRSCYEHVTADMLTQQEFDLTGITLDAAPHTVAAADAEEADMHLALQLQMQMNGM